MKETPPLRGVLYIATGASYARAANGSAASVRAQCPGLQIDICTDQPEVLDASLYDRVVPITSPHRRSKVDYLTSSRFDETLFLDTDTRVVEDITEIFGLLETHDIAMAHAHKRNGKGAAQIWRRPLPAAYPQLNSGVLLYRRSEEVWSFLRDWQAAFQVAQLSKDQVTLRELAFESALRIHVLPPEYNVRFEKFLKVWDDDEAVPKIMHLQRYHQEVGAVDSRPRQKVSRRLARLWGKLRPRSAAPKRKVFCIGFNKTGTTSLSKALRVLGYRTLHGRIPGAHGQSLNERLIAQMNEGNYELPTLKLYDAFSDLPYSAIWRQLERQYPDAYFILTLRDEDAWIKSCLGFYGPRRIFPMREWRFGEYANPASSEEARNFWVEAYRQHNREVLAHFDGKPNFLVMNIGEGDSWDKLCAFLGCKKPWRSFPHRNRRKT